MDASKKAVKYIKYGHWPEKKVRLTQQQWEDQVNHALYLSKDIFNNLSEFMPIYNLINVKKENYELITDPEAVVFSEGINLDTHCKEVHGKIESYNTRSKVDDDLFIWQKAFITRKMKWIGWNNYVKSEFTFSEHGKLVSKKDSSFRSKFFALDLKTLLQWDPLFGRQFISHLLTWLYGDLYRSRDDILKKERLLMEITGIEERMAEAVEY